MNCPRRRLELRQGACTRSVQLHWNPDYSACVPNVTKGRQTCGAFKEANTAAIQLVIHRLHEVLLDAVRLVGERREGDGTPSHLDLPSSANRPQSEPKSAHGADNAGPPGRFVQAGPGQRSHDANGTCVQGRHEPCPGCDADAVCCACSIAQSQRSIREVSRSAIAELDVRARCTANLCLGSDTQRQSSW